MILFIPGELVSLITFPGVILHELSHKIACDLLEIPVYRVCYFSLSKEASGYVVHQKITRASHAFLVGIAPLIVNSVMSIILLLPFVLSFQLGTTFIYDTTLDPYIIWMGLSIAFHAFPSEKDIKEAFDLAQGLFANILLTFIQVMIVLFDIPVIGSLLKIGYGFGISYIFATLFV